MWIFHLQLLHLRARTDADARADDARADPRAITRADPRADAGPDGEDNRSCRVELHRKLSMRKYWLHD